MNARRTDVTESRGDAARRGSDDASTVVVLFRLAKRYLAFPLEIVSEILPIVAITEIPDAPAWVPGAINLRGRALAVVDLRERFGLPRREVDPHARIIVAAPRDRDQVGFIVDQVLEVLTLPKEAMDPVDAIGGDEQPVDALARHEDHLIVILDVDRLVAAVSDLTLPEDVG